MELPRDSFCGMDRENRRLGFLAYELLLLLIVLPVCLFGACLLVNSAKSGISEVSLSDHSVFRLSLDRDEKGLWIYCRHQDVVQLNLESPGIAKSLPLLGVDLLAVAHSRDGHNSLLCYQDGTVAIFCDEDEAQIVRRTPPVAVISAVVSAEGTIATTATADGRIQGWSRNGNQWREFQFGVQSQSAVNRVFLNPSGTRLCIARVNGHVSIHHSETGEPVGDMLDAGRYCNGFACSEDQRWLAAYTDEGLVQVFDLATNQPLYADWQQVTNVTGIPTALEFSPDGRRLAIATNTVPNINIVDVATGRPAGVLAGHTGIVRSVQFSANSGQLYSGGLDGTIREWSLETRTQNRFVPIPRVTLP